MGAPRVCVAGITEAGVVVRPNLPNPGIHEDWLYNGDEVIIRPFARVTLDLLRRDSRPPHTEDWRINPQIKRLEGMLDEGERARHLQEMDGQCVDQLFGAPVRAVGRGFYVQAGEGLRSLATIRPKYIDFVRLCEEHGNFKYKITFVDSTDHQYELTVTDLSFRYYLDHLRASRGWSCGRIGINLQQEFNRATTYLRIGLTRGFNPEPRQPQNRCYLQITGVYSFPDYLNGRCFADYRQQFAERV